jgi:diguanylate cyclase (GGDEF)-like protein
MTGKATILLVDDTRTNIEMLAACLQHNYHLKVAMNGIRCLEIANKAPIPDLILLDVMMPDMDGYEVCRKLKENPVTKDIPIIFVTGKNSDEDEEYGLQLGAVDYITKPIRPAIVSARVGTQIIVKQQSDALRDMALHDQLTSLFNRHFLIEAAKNKISRLSRHGGKLSVMMIDIDNFKLVNDNFGHKGGDVVLQAIAHVLSDFNRKEDVVARFGGEEFVILLDHCSLADTQDKAEQLRMKIEQLNPEEIHVTASFGIAELQSDNEGFEHLLARADEAVYLAKEKGRNCIVKARDVLYSELKAKS